MSLPWYLQPPVDPRAAYFDQPYAVLDLETTNLSKGDPLVPENRVVLACAGAGGRSMTVPIPEIQWWPAGGLLVAHNAKFELMWLNREGVDTAELLPWDTMIAEYVLAGNRRVDLSLDAVARRYGLPGKDPVVDALMRGGVCPSDMPRHLLEARCRRDVETTEAIFLLQRAELDRRGLLGVMFTRCILTPVLAAIEAEGMSLDVDAVRKESVRVRREMQDVERELATITGGINLRSTKQLGEFLYDTLKFKELTDRRGNPRRTGTGMRLTDADSLTSLVGTSPSQREFIKLRKVYGDLNARLTKTLDFLSAVCATGGRFYGSFHQTRTQTHRLSSSGRKIPVKDSEGKVKERGIQFQNLPVEYKRLFTTHEHDYQMVEIDGTQLEFRVAAYLGQDSRAVADIVSGHDVHAYTASILNRCTVAEVSKGERSAAKADTFKPLYGGTRGTKAQEEYYEAFRARYARIEAVQKGWVHTVLREKELKTVTGLTFYFPGCRLTESGYVEQSASIYNFPIQSLATADIMPISITHLYWKTRGLRAKMTNTVHDSAVLEVHKDDVNPVRVAAEEAFGSDTYRFLSDVYGIAFNIPLGIGITVGSHWGEGTETKVELPNAAVETLGAV